MKRIKSLKGIKRKLRKLNPPTGSHAVRGHNRLGFYRRGFARKENSFSDSSEISLAFFNKPERYKNLDVNKPVASNRKNKKKMVLVSKNIGGEKKYKVVHYGHKEYGHNYSKEARKNYLKRSAGIKSKDGSLTKDDKFSPNYWARKDLWSKKTKPMGSGKFK